MLHRILMDVIESRPIRPFVSQPCVPKVVPDRPTGCRIEAVQPLGSFFVKLAKHGPQAARVLLNRWRVCDEVIMVREHGPSFELPAKVARYREETTMKHAQSFCTPKVVGFEIGSGRDEISA